MTTLLDISQVLLAILAALGGIVAIIAWFYKRGGQERAFTDALDENTKSNRELSGELRDFKGETLKTLRDLDWRVKIVEGKLQ